MISPPLLSPPLLSVDEALARCLALITPLQGEATTLRHAFGRMMLTPATARRDQPPFAAAAMDGYAVAGDHPAYPVIGEVGAGHAFAAPLAPGQSIRIFTGAPVPAGATRVIIQEDVIRTGDTISVRPGADSATHIRAAGQDFRHGDRLQPRRLTANDLALLAAMNVPQVTTSRRPEVALIATGDELVWPGDDPSPSQIVASNTFALAALIEAEGGIARVLPIARDTEADLGAVLTMALDADLIVTIGGASVGDHDLVARVATDMGLQSAFWKIAMRPGKPLMAGRLREKPLIGLPGNPVSSIVCGHLFVLPMVRALQSRPDLAPRPRRARLGQVLDANGPRAHYMRALVTEAEDLPLITAFAMQDSSQLRLLAQANALLIRPPGDGPRAAGDTVTYLPL